ncbi:MAG TPA: pantoate--beta-alanine ligase [Solimonas sp.]|nr:pantoate--beta-alanine ligase [Solimonas sp.]
MKTVHTVAELRAQVAEWRRAGQRIAFAPTMGNLHAGHLKLIRRAREEADRVVSSVFVNPLQFGPTEDFGRYPRTLSADQAGLSTVGCDLLFAPSVEEMYPNGREHLCKLSLPHYSTMLEGAFRPGHFDGVATVVSILFNQVQPDVALFGEKDYQQLLVIRRMVADLHLPIRILGVPTEREADGLAMSSRNQYLSSEERQTAAQIYASLSEVADGLRAGRRDFEQLAAGGLQRLLSHGFQPQYLEIRSPDLAPPGAQDASYVILVAAYLGKTRLIDNLIVTV